MEYKLKEYLENKIGIPVVINVSGREEEYIKIRKNGESGNNFVRSAMFTIRSYAQSDYSASLINEKVVEAMLDAPIYIPELSKVVLNSSGDQSNVIIREYCNQAIFDIVFNVV